MAKPYDAPVAGWTQSAEHLKVFRRLFQVQNRSSEFSYDPRKGGKGEVALLWLLHATCTVL